MNDTHEMCAHCGQWLNLSINHYAEVTTADGRKYYLHQRPCLDRFSEEHQVSAVNEHQGQEASRLYTHVPRFA